MTVGFLCSMIQPNVDVFVDMPCNMTRYTKAGKLLENNMTVADWMWLECGAVVITTKGATV